MTTQESLIKAEARRHLIRNRWHYRSIASNQFTRAGLPDAYAIKNGVTIFIEFKSDKGKQTPAQIQEMNDIIFNGGHYILAHSITDFFNYCDEKGIKI